MFWMHSWTNLKTKPLNMKSKWLASLLLSRLKERGKTDTLADIKKCKLHMPDLHVKLN